MEVLYRIEEFNTTGWELINEHEVQLTREVCAQHIQNYMAQKFQILSFESVVYLTYIFIYKGEGKTF